MSTHHDPSSIKERRLRQALNPRAVYAWAFGSPIDYDLRRVGLPQAKPALVGRLSLGEFRSRESVLPAEIIPIVDRKRQDDNSTSTDQRFYGLISLCTACAPLRGEQLHHVWVSGRASGLGFTSPESAYHRKTQHGARGPSNLAKVPHRTIHKPGSDHSSPHLCVSTRRSRMQQPTRTFR